MADGIADENIGNLPSDTGGLDITDSGPQQPRSLIAAIDELDQTVDSLKRQLKNCKKLLVNNSLNNGDAACQVSGQISSIRNVAEGLNNAAVESVVTHITSLEKRKAPHTLKLLDHFDLSIKMIVERLLARGNDANTLWKIVEECCMQAVVSGELDPDDYLAAIHHPEPLSYPDEDMEARQRHVEDNKKSVRDDWARFWAQCLNKCRNGPTLFIPPKGILPFEYTPSAAEDLPRYLFLPYPSIIPGGGDPKTFSSKAHKAYGYAHRKKDIFSKCESNASSLLHRHLHGPLSRADNLFTWGSSLLFAIQIAVHHCCNDVAQTPNKTVILALDTSKFPKGQFVSTAWLRGRLSKTAPDEKNTGSRKLLSDKGRYISQGILNVQGRSCIISLLKLHQAGLGSLYQELSINPQPDALVRKTCGSYLTGLEKRWKRPWETTKNEIAAAINIAEECFGPFDKLDIALFFLGLHKRKIKIDGRQLVLEGLTKQVRRHVALESDQAELNGTKPVDAFTCLAELFVLSPSDSI